MGHSARNSKWRKWQGDRHYFPFLTILPLTIVCAAPHLKDWDRPGGELQQFYHFVVLFLSSLVQPFLLPYWYQFIFIKNSTVHQTQTNLHNIFINSPISIYQYTVLNNRLDMRLRGINYRVHKVYYMEPHKDVNCFRLNFKILELGYFKSTFLQGFGIKF